MDGPEALPCGIFVDEEGDWYHQGNKIFRDEVIEFFFENLHVTSDGRFLLEWKNTRCVLDVADTPFVISRVDLEKTDQGEQVLLSFRHLVRRQPLAPGTLWIGEGNVLYCRVHEAGFRARFSRPAYYQFAAWIEEGDEGFFIGLNGIRHYIRKSEQASPSSLPSGA